jgi:hypothetical protein
MRIAREGGEERVERSRARATALALSLDDDIDRALRAASMAGMRAEDLVIVLTHAATEDLPRALRDAPTLTVRWREHLAEALAVEQPTIARVLRKRPTCGAIHIVCALSDFVHVASRRAVPSCDA